MISKYYTHARTYYSQYYGVPVAKYADKNNVKLYLGVFMTSETWQSAKIDNAVAAVKTYPGTVAAILVGNENLMNGVKAADILNIVSTIKTRLGSKLAATVKFGTVQRKYRVFEFCTNLDDIRRNAIARGIDQVKAVANRVPSTAKSTNLKIWFSFFDRRPDDDSMGVDLEKHFGQFTYDRLAKSTDPDYPRRRSTTTVAIQTNTRLGLRGL
ncbi:hypothetical protein DVH05_022485 [Phytophthora capsici]|nr:hypothetical protein DVH05_022485 [Phytophthora capsici]